MLGVYRSWVAGLSLISPLSCFSLAAMVASLSVGISAARAQDPAKVASDNYKVIFENDDVRVLEVTGKAGDKGAMHSHPDHVVYAMNACKVKFTFADGKSKDVDMKAGEAKWTPAETHESQILDGKDFKVVIFEMKKPAGAKPSKMADAEDQAKTSADVTKVILENDRVRVLETRLKPGAKLIKHSHPAHVAYAVSSAKVKFTTFPGDQTDEKSMAAGQAFATGPVTHVVENIGSTDAHSLLVEIK